MGIHGGIGPLQAVTPSIMHPWNVFVFASLSVMVISFNEVSGQQDCEGNWVNGKCIDHSIRKRRSCEILENGVCKEDDRKRRSTCEDGVLVNGKCETTERKRRSNECKEWDNGVCQDNERKRRSNECKEWKNGVCQDNERKRRSNDCKEWENGVCMDNGRKRRSNDCKEWVNGVCKDNERKRRSTCENGVLINGVCKETADRKRHSNIDELCVIDVDDGDSDDKCQAPQREPQFIFV